MADTSPVAELLPCPFCGGSAQESNSICGGVSEAYIECSHCGISTKASESRAEVIGEWNRRATPPSPSTAPEVDERAAFEAWHRSKFATKHSTGQPTRDMHNGIYAEQYGPVHQQQMWEAWQASALASRPAEVDDERLPPLPRREHEYWDVRSQQHIQTGGYTPQQYRQGQRDAVAADRARREVGGKIPRESNDALIKLAKYWKLDGDWMTCRGCRRSLIASRDGEELNHGDGCKFWDQQHPWAQLRGLIARQPAPAECAS